MVGWVSPLVCAADKYGIGVCMQRLHWVVENFLPHFLPQTLNFEIIT